MTPRTSKRMQAAPNHFSARGQALWDRLHEANRVYPDSDELLRRALLAFDLADSLLERARRPGIKLSDERALLSASRDASMVGLKLMKSVGLDRADIGPARRPGRPSDIAWSQQRRGGAA